MDIMRGQRIGNWLRRKRSQARQGKLSCERIQLIEDALGVDALIVTRDFERSLAEVAHYKSTYGCLPVRSTDDLLMRRLSTWLKRQRQIYNGGRQAEAHTQRLDSVLGPEWRPTFKNHMVRLTTHVLDSASAFKIQ